MTQELVWFNGEIIPMSEARIGVEERGFQFADGVYDVVRVYHGRPFTLKEHLDRLERSAGGIKLALPISRVAIEEGLLKLIAKSDLREGMVYMQATRGAAPRNHIFPEPPQGTLLAYCRDLPPVQNPGEGEGAKLLAVPDERWKRCWIKSIALLPNVLAKNEAISHGYDEAVFIENGIVTECSASNLIGVIDGRLVTHPVGPKVLPGITRAVLLGCASELGIEVTERAMSGEEAIGARELFITSTTREVSWVARWNDHVIGNGLCGPITLKLHRLLQQRVRRETLASAIHA